MMTATDGTLSLRIVQDPDPIDPRGDCECLGTMVCWHGRLSLGDVQPNRTPSQWLEDHEDVRMLPLYLLDHSGLRMNTTGFRHLGMIGRFDSGPVGFIYTTLRRACELGVVWNDELDAQLAAEVEEYDAFLRGDIYGYKLEELRGGEWHEVDSCWGFIGTDWQANGMADALGEHRALLNILRED